MNDTKTMQQFYRKVEDDIRRYGCSIVCVSNDCDDGAPAFAYTIGNQCQGLPELLVIGVFKQRHMLNDLSEVMRQRGAAFDDGELIDIAGWRPFKIINADDRARQQSGR